MKHFNVILLFVYFPLLIHAQINPKITLTQQQLDSIIKVNIDNTKNHIKDSIKERLIKLKTDSLNKSNFDKLVKHVADSLNKAKEDSTLRQKGINITFFGTGEIQKSLTEGKEIPATTGIGLYFERSNFLKDYYFPFSFKKRNKKKELDSLKKGKRELMIIKSYTEDSIKNKVKDTLKTGICRIINNNLIANKKFKTNNKYYTLCDKLKTNKIEYNKIKKDKRKCGLIVRKIELEISINIASTVDTIKAQYNNDTISNTRDFGFYTLNPLSTKQATYLRYRLDFGQPFGIQLLFISSNRVWKTKEKNYWVTGTAFNADFFYEFVPRWIKIPDYSFIVGGGYIMRRLSGDIENDDNFRRSILNDNTNKTFHGIGLFAILKIKNVQVSVSYPIILGQENKVPGLTGGQLITSIRFSGGFPLKLN